MVCVCKTLSTVCKHRGCIEACMQTTFVWGKGGSCCCDFAVWGTSVGLK
jgi:hypothetical protein